MGLLERAKNSKNRDLSNSKEIINTTALKKFHSKQIKNEEKHDAVERVVKQNLKNGTINSHRPIGDLKEIKKKETKTKKGIIGEIDIKKIHSEIQKELGLINGTEEKKFQKLMCNISGKRNSTGITGLDGIMGGGFRNKSINLVGGGPGAGKSIFCMQFLVKGIEKFEENGIYISFEEDPERIVKDYDDFNWDLRKKIKDKKLSIMFYTPEQVEKVLQAGGGIIRDTIEDIGAKRLVIDSLTGFSLLHESEIEKRRAFLRLFEEARKWGVTSLMIAEHDPDPDRHKDNVLEFETDAVLLLYNIRKGDVRERSLEIFKMRGSSHSARIFPMRITQSGMKVFPNETVF